MSRSKWKCPYIITGDRKNKKKFWKSQSQLPKALLNNYVSIYNGKIFKKMVISREKLGFKIGEFRFTRTKSVKKIDKTKKVKNKK